MHQKSNTLLYIFHTYWPSSGKSVPNMNHIIETGTDDQEKLPIIPGVNYISLTQDNKNKDILNAGLTYESPKPLGFYSWEGILENNAGSQHVHFQPLFPGTQPDNMGINSNFSQGEEIMVPYLTTSIAKQHENGSLIQAEGNWQVLCTSKISTSSASGTYVI